MQTFSERVIKAALSIPKGRVSTYGRIARAAGGGGQAARSVNAILVKAYRNGETVIPFHRIVYSNGTAWLSDEYTARRMKLYKAEGIEVDKSGKIQDFADTVFDFK